MTLYHKVGGWLVFNLLLLAISTTLFVFISWGRISIIESFEGSLIFAVIRPVVVYFRNRVPKQGTINVRPIGKTGN